MTRQVVNKFIELCPICNLKKTQVSQPRLKPIRSEGFWHRIQIDLIDMRSNKCLNNGIEYSWVAHVEDHFSKQHVIWPQTQKCAKEVVSGLETRVLAYFGLPKIIQCDNGLEFKNELMRELVNSWEGNIKNKFLFLAKIEKNVI